MTVLRALLIVTAVGAVAALPCAVGLLIIYLDEAAERSFKAVRRGLRKGWRAMRSSRLLRRLGGRADAAVERVPDVPAGPPIEHVAADLRRLSRQRTGVASRSPIWYTAVQRAHDERLRVACRQLGIEEHLSELTGVDLDVERVRVEGTLEATGLLVRDPDSQPHEQGYEQR